MIIHYENHYIIAAICLTGDVDAERYVNLSNHIYNEMS